MASKIIQIAAAADVLYALDDDGNIWVAKVDLVGNTYWEKVKGPKGHSD